MSAENVWQQALFTVQTKFSFEFFIAKTFPAFFLQQNNKTAINYSSLTN